VPIGDAEFPVYVFAVALDGGGGNTQLIGNLFSAQTLCEQVEQASSQGLFAEIR
jgi:hypothetical protein